jgi:hypothetical protein
MENFNDLILYCMRKDIAFHYSPDGHGSVRWRLEYAGRAYYDTTLERALAQVKADDACL